MHFIAGVMKWYLGLMVVRSLLRGVTMIFLFYSRPRHLFCLMQPLSHILPGLKNIAIPGLNQLRDAAAEAASERAITRAYEDSGWLAHAEQDAWEYNRARLDRQSCFYGDF